TRRRVEDASAVRSARISGRGSAEASSTLRRVRTDSLLSRSEDRLRGTDSAGVVDRTERRCERPKFGRVTGDSNGGQHQACGDDEPVGISIGLLANQRLPALVGQGLLVGHVLPLLLSLANHGLGHFPGAGPEERPTAELRRLETLQVFALAL